MSGINKLGGAHAGTHVTQTHQSNDGEKAKQNAPAQHHAATPKRPSGAGRHTASENVATRRGMDVNLQKARINALLTAQAHAAQNSASVPVSLPGQRHDGSNRYDKKPITDRTAGDPDRYRAVNPTVVSRQNGHYYFPAKVKPGTHYFDKEHKTLGRVMGSDVKIDFSRVRMMRGADGKKHRYVYAQGLGYVREAALTNSLQGLKQDLKSGPAFKFELVPGEHQLYDGFGKERGKLDAASVKLNFGQEMEINGEKYYYVFNTILEAGVNVSGWVKASALKDKPYPLSAAEVRKLQPEPARAPFDTTYDITGGDPQAVGAGGKYRFGYVGMLNGKQQFISYKVKPGVSLAQYSNVAATDYLKRSDNIVNMGYNLAGLSNDTFRVDGDTRLVFHHNSKDKEATVKIPLYHPKDATHAGKQPVAYMTFVYGYVDTAAGRRTGWMALDALTPKP